MTGAGGELVGRRFVRGLQLVVPDGRAAESGWSGGAIERRYKSCSADKKDGNNASRDTGDLCWGTDNATFSLNGKGDELVRDDATGTWRPRHLPGRDG